MAECIKNLDWIDEGFLTEGLKDYIQYHFNEEKLYAAAEYFAVPRADIDYWLEEARNDSDE